MAQTRHMGFVRNPVLTRRALGSACNRVGVVHTVSGWVARCLIARCSPLQGQVYRRKRMLLLLMIIIIPIC